MKKIYALFTVIMLLLMLCIPIVAVSGANVELPQLIVPKKASDGETFRLMLSGSGEVVTLERDEYIFGVVAAEMMPGWPEEALKAQAVASYTFLLRRASENSDKAYDITDSCATDQAYCSRADAMAKWGSGAADYCAKLDAAVAAVSGQVIIDDDGNPILAAYHSTSGGRTESAKVAWGVDYSYLQSVESTCDLLAPDYLYERSFTDAEFAELMAAKVKLSGSVYGQIGGIQRSTAGTVTGITVGGVQLSGADLRSSLGLRSANFEVLPIDGGVKIRTQGYGHGVGMSQFGANYMAQQGSTYIEILAHYYTGCRLKTKS